MDKMTDERPSRVEQLAVARLSEDLTLKKHRCDVDVLIAAAYSAMRNNPGAAALVRLRLSLDENSWSAALARATLLAKRLEHRERWRLEEIQVQALARIALKQFLVPACPKCHGQRFEEIPGTHRLGKKVCKVCLGSGERPLPRDSGRQIRAILCALEEDQANINSALRGVMR